MVDLYTKAVLTLIAAALAVLATENLTERGRAGPLDPTDIRICGRHLGTCVEPEMTTETVMGHSFTSFALPIVSRDKPK